MAVRKRPEIRTSAERAEKAPSPTLMANQDTSARGDSTATRTSRITFSTTEEVARAVSDAAHDRRMSRSQLIEAALRDYLGL